MTTAICTPPCKQGKDSSCGSQHRGNGTRSNKVWANCPNAIQCHMKQHTWHARGSGKGSSARVASPSSVRRCCSEPSSMLYPAFTAHNASCFVVACAWYFGSSQLCAYIIELIAASTCSAVAKWQRINIRPRETHMAVRMACQLKSTKVHNSTYHLDQRQDVRLLLATAASKALPRYGEGVWMTSLADLLHVVSWQGLLRQQGLLL